VLTDPGTNARTVHGGEHPPRVDRHQPTACTAPLAGSPSRTTRSTRRRRSASTSTAVTAPASSLLPLRPVVVAAEDLDLLEVHRDLPKRSRPATACSGSPLVEAPSQCSTRSVRSVDPVPRSLEFTVPPCPPSATVCRPDSHESIRVGLCFIFLVQRGRPIVTRAKNMTS